MSSRPVHLPLPALHRAALVLLFLALAWGAANALAQPAKEPLLPATVTRGPSIEGVSEFRLEANGLRVLLVPDQTKPSITVNITYLVGSRHENYGETGMAHLLEHLLFKGSPAHPDLSSEFKQRGIRWNASTSVDRTNYFQTFAATGDNLEWVLRMEADRMLNAFVAKKDLDSEMTVVRNEMESGENNPGRVLYQRMLGVAYEWHNYGKSTIGARADVENVRIERLQGFYRRHYQPDNAVLIVGGRFDEAKTLATIAEVFGALPRPARALEPTYTVDPVQDGERQVTLRRTADIQYVAALYHAPPAAHPDYVPLAAVSEVLGDTPSGRLHKALVETRKATSVSAFMRDTREPGHVVFFAAANKGDPIDEVRRVLLEVVEDSAAKPFTAEELKRVQTASAKDFEQTIASPDSLVSALSEAIAAGDWRLFFYHRDRLAKLTTDDLAQAAAKYLKPANRTLGVFIPTDRPDRAPSPTLVDASAAVEDYKGREAMAQGEAFDPTPANIDARTVRATLPNGMKLVLLPRKTRGSVVNASLALHFGDEKSLVGMRETASLAGGMLMRGTKSKSRQEIRDAFDALKTDVSVNGGAQGASAGLLTTREGLAPSLRLLAEVLREPSFPVSEFDQLRKQAITGVDAARREPGSVAGRAVQRHFNRHPPADVRYVPSPEERIAAYETVTREQVAAFHRDFYGARGAELAVVGDFDPEEVRALAAELFGGWTAAKDFTRVPLPWQQVAPGSFKLETPDKANAVYVAAAPLPVRDDAPDAMALSVANTLLGGSETSRLWVRVREKDGLSYDVRSSVALNSDEANSAWTVTAIFAPQNLERLRTAIGEEVARAHAEGFSEREVEDAKQSVLERRRLGRTDDGGLASALASLAHRDRTAAFLGENDRRIGALTAADVNAALRRYLRLESLTTAVAGDFGKQ
jgi:zinc protease